LIQKNSIKQQLPIMSFQAYLDNIKAKSGKTPDDFKKLAEEKGFMMDGKLNPTTKATEITNWLKEAFDLGHGHAMAIVASFKGKTE
jgi:arginine utilization protein RocB